MTRPGRRPGLVLSSPRRGNGSPKPADDRSSRPRALRRSRMHPGGCGCAPAACAVWVGSSHPPTSLPPPRTARHGPESPVSGGGETGRRRRHSRRHPCPHRRCADARLGGADKPADSPQALDVGRSPRSGWRSAARRSTAPVGKARERVGRAPGRRRNRERARLRRPRRQSRPVPAIQADAAGRLGHLGGERTATCRSDGITRREEGDACGSWES